MEWSVTCGVKMVFLVTDSPWAKVRGNENGPITTPAKVEVKGAQTGLTLPMNIKYDLGMMHTFSKFQYHPRLQSGNNVIALKT